MWSWKHAFYVFRKLHFLLFTVHVFTIFMHAPYSTQYKDIAINHCECIKYLHIYILKGDYPRCISVHSYPFNFERLSIATARSGETFEHVEDFLEFVAVRFSGRNVGQLPFYIGSGTPPGRLTRSPFKGRLVTWSEDKACGRCPPLVYYLGKIGVAHARWTRFKGIWFRLMSLNTILLGLCFGIHLVQCHFLCYIYNR